MEDYTPFYGLGIDFLSCNSYQVYGTSQSGQFAKLDLLAKTIEPVNCSGFVTQPLGIAFPNEFQASECDPILFDLDEDNSSGLNDFNFQSFLCPHSSGSIVDVDLLFETVESIDSITVQFVENPPDGFHEILLAPPTNQITFAGNGTQRLTILPLSTATSLSDFKNALLSSSYQNTAPDPTLNVERIIEFKVWLNNGLQLSAHTFVTIKWPYAGQDVDTVICTSNSVLNLNYLLDDEADQNGYFVAVEPVDSNNQLPTIKSSGVFLYIVPFNNCLNDTAVISVVYDDPSFSFGPNLNIYDHDPDTVLLEIGIPTSSVIWQDSSTESFYEVTKSGLYGADIISVHGCTASDNIWIRFLDTIYYNIDLHFCQGEICELGNGTFTEDTSICIINTNINWYIFKYCYHLHFQPNYEKIGTTICQGDTLYFKDSIYTEAGNYSHFSKSKCGGLTELNLSFWPTDTSYLSIQLEDGNTFEMNGIRLSSNGEYEFLLQNEKGCDSLVLVNVGLESLNIYAPTAFSPNHDGINDKFNLFAGPPVQSINYLKIFDRWGDLVFHGKDFPPNLLNAGWDGKAGGVPATRGTYIWLAEVLLKNGEKKFLKGEVFLMK
ncbi:MAG: gliding motility-associated C-terminal domain-containing protein [Saprospiraceae bacterium]